MGWVNADDFGMIARGYGPTNAVTSSLAHKERGPMIDLAERSTEAQKPNLGFALPPRLLFVSRRRRLITGDHAQSRAARGQATPMPSRQHRSRQ